MKSPWLLRLATLVLLLLLQACAGYGGGGLRPGASADEVRSVMGEPAAIYADPAGGWVWAYPRGPVGLHTFMVSFDASGALARVEQVLDDRGFARLRAGADREADVLRLFGPPWQVTAFERSKERVLSWRFRDAWGSPAQFHVVLDQAGLVLRWMQVPEDTRSNRWDVP